MSDQYKKETFFNNLSNKIESVLRDVSYKTSIDSEFAVLPPQPLISLSLLTGMLASAIVGIKMKKLLLNTAKATENQIEQLKENAGLPNIPLISVPNLGNAYYRSKPIFGSLKREIENLVGSASKKRVENADKYGYIAYAPSFKTIGVIGHELGHANIGNRPWYSLSRFNQSFLYPISKIVNIAGVPFSLIIGAGTRSPLVGGLAGLSIGALTGLPVLINELQATRFSNKLMEKVNAREFTKEKNKKILKQAFKTYFAGMVIPSAVAGLLGPFVNIEVR